MKNVKYSRRGTRQEVAPHLIVVLQGGCKENEDPAIILCGLATSKPGGRAWTPQKYLSQLGVSRQGAERARQYSNECYPHDDQTAPRSKSHAANAVRRSGMDAAGKSREGCFVSPASTGTYASDRPSSIRPTVLTGPSYNVLRGIV